MLTCPSGSANIGRRHAWKRVAKRQLRIGQPACAGSNWSGDIGELGAVELSLGSGANGVRVMAEGAATVATGLGGSFVDRWRIHEPASDPANKVADGQRHHRSIRLW
jgi:hypothetical protein